MSAGSKGTELGRQPSEDELHRKTTLPNGIRVVTESIPHLHSVSVGIWVNSGSRDEDDQEQGIAHFIEHMFFKGTERRSALQIAKELDAVGGFANAFTSKENICCHAKVLASHLPLVVDVLSDIFLHSVFSDHDIDRERDVILQEIRMIEETPDEHVQILFHKDFWKGDPLGNPIYGSESSVSRMDRKAILRFRDRTFIPDRIVVAAAGRLDHERFVELIGPRFEQWRRPCLGSHRAKPINHYGFRSYRRDVEQVHILMGMEGCSHKDEDRFACNLFNVVFGSSMSSRLFQEIRERRGLAYSVYSFVNSYEDTGILGVYAAVAADRVQHSLDVLYRELERIPKDPIGEDELAAAKEYLKGSLYLSAESTDARMHRLARNELVFNRFVPFDEVEAKIMAVRPDDIQRWFERNYHPERLAVLLYGPIPHRVRGTSFHGK